MLSKLFSVSAIATALTLIGCTQKAAPAGAEPAQAPPPASAPSAAVPQQPDHVNIEDFSFVPEVITVPAGTKVTWVNKDGSRHTTTSDSGLFDSGPLAQKEEFSYTFPSAGTYTYHCDIHKKMTGKVIVK